MKRLIVLVFVVFFLASCAGLWSQVGGSYSSPEKDFVVDLPSGWMKANNTDFLLLTRDGLLLQNILIKKMAISEELQHSKKKFRPDMLPQEQAELVADDFASNDALLNLTIIENSPVIIDSHKGFRLVFTYKNADGLRAKSVLLGFLDQDFFYQLRYTAAARYYYDKDYGAFAQMVDSFRLAAR